jgi:hypothetical protein
MLSMDAALERRADIEPILPPPPGVVSEFKYHTGTLSHITNAIGPICIAITTTAVLIRVITKFRVVGRFKWDDCMLYHGDPSQKRY